MADIFSACHKKQIADLRDRIAEGAIDDIHKDGHDALMSATYQGFVLGVKLLLEQGANVHYVHPQFKIYTLDIAKSLWLLNRNVTINDRRAVVASLEASGASSTKNLGKRCILIFGLFWHILFGDYFRFWKKCKRSFCNMSWTRQNLLSLQIALLAKMSTQCRRACCFAIDVHINTKHNSCEYPVELRTSPFWNLGIFWPPSWMKWAHSSHAHWERFLEHKCFELDSTHMRVIPEYTDRYAVIVEPRCHPHLEAVIRITMHSLGPEWGLQIFHGSANENFVRSMCAGWSHVHFYNLGVPNLSLPEYNCMCLDEKGIFWSNVLGEHILQFETDSVLVRRGIDRFLGYSYVGAPWSWALEDNKPFVVGNSGLSLKKKADILSLLGDMGNVDKSGAINCDVAIAKAFCRKGNEVAIPEVAEARRFASETIYFENALGVHKPWRYHLPSQMEKLLPL